MLLLYSFVRTISSVLINELIGIIKNFLLYFTKFKTASDEAVFLNFFPNRKQVVLNGKELFPLYGSGGLRSHIVTNSVDAGNFFDDPFGYFIEYSPVGMFDSGGHCVYRVDGTDDNRPFPAAGVIADAHRLDIGNKGKVLPYLAL